MIGNVTREAVRDASRPEQVAEGTTGEGAWHMCTGRRSGWRRRDFLPPDGCAAAALGPADHNRITNAPVTRSHRALQGGSAP